MAERIGDVHGDKTGWLRTFIIDNRVVLTILDNPDAASGTPDVFCVARDFTGTYSWELAMRYHPLRERPEPLPRSGIPSRALSTGTDEQTPTNVPYATLFGDSEPKVTAQDLEHGIADYIADAFATMDSMLVKSTGAMATVARLASEQARAERSAHGCTTATPALSPQLPKPVYKDNLSHFQAGRMLMSQLGLLDPDNRDRVIHVPHSPGWQQQLVAVDAINERVCFSVSVLFGETAPKALQSLFNQPSRETVSQDYVDMLSALGWVVELGTHKGYCGRLDLEPNVTVPYFSNQTLEIVFHSPCVLSSAAISGDLKTNGGDNAADGRLKDHFPDVEINSVNTGLLRLLSDNHVHIVWLENAAGYADMVLQIRQACAFVFIICVFPIVDACQIVAMFSRTAKSAAFLIVQPLHPLHGLYVVRKVSSDTVDTFETGPLLDGQVVSRHALGHLLRQTAISLQLHCAAPVVLPYFARKLSIELLSQQYRAQGDPASLVHYYLPLYS